MMNSLPLKHVAKVVLIDPDGHYLLMQRSDHPTFGDDPDLPGGTMEAGEDSVQTLLREVAEEIGVELQPNEVEHRHTSNQYSRHGTTYHLFSARVQSRPEIIMSWEHAGYEWLEPAEFLIRAKNATDTYMHMVHDVMHRKDK